jgi:hypothetical protein
MNHSQVPPRTRQEILNMADDNVSHATLNGRRCRRRRVVSSFAARSGPRQRQQNPSVIGPGGRGFGAHVKSLARLHSEGANIELVAVS